MPNEKTKIYKIKQIKYYNKQLTLNKTSLIFFIEAIDKANREKYEGLTVDEQTKVSVEAIFIATS